MARGMKAVAAGAAGLAGGAIAARRVRDRGSGRSRPGKEVQAVTVLAPMEEVRAGWKDHAARAGLADVEVEFRPAPGDRGTEVLARPGGRAEGTDGTDESEAGTGPGRRMGGEAPGPRLRAELRRFKSRLEAGTVVSTEGQPSGRGSWQETATRAVTDRLRAWGAA
jgi:hypothetical protein